MNILDRILCLYGTPKKEDIGKIIYILIKF